MRDTTGLMSSGLSETKDVFHIQCSWPQEVFELKRQELKRQKRRTRKWPFTKLLIQRRRSMLLKTRSLRLIHLSHCQGCTILSEARRTEWLPVSTTMSYYRKNSAWKILVRRSTRESLATRLTERFLSQASCRRQYNLTSLFLSRAIPTTRDTLKKQSPKSVRLIIWGTFEGIEASTHQCSLIETRG